MTRGRVVRRARVLLVAGMLALGAACTPPGLPPPVAPGTAVTTGSAVRPAGTVTVGMDGAIGGFNPHQIADASPVTTAVDSLVLPSVATRGPSGALTLNRDLLDSAEVTSSDPFTITYRIATAASWSDGTPITAEDFSYLRGQLLLRPGTVNPAPYRLITAIRSLDAGKTVQVEFSSPVPAWELMFSPLLPSHLLKDSPGGWATGLAGGIPVSANRYKVQSVDTTTGEIALARNDKYWGSQPGPTAVIIRSGTSSVLLAALRRGDVQALFVRPGAADERQLNAQVPATDRREVALPATVQLVFDTTAGVTRSVTVRRAIARALDPVMIRSVLGGGREGALIGASSQVSLPAGLDGRRSGDGLPGVPTADPSGATGELTAAGWTRGGSYFVQDGQLLRLALAYQPGDERLAAAAVRVQAQLGDVGIEVDLVRLTTAEILARLTAGTVQLALLVVPRVADDESALVSAFDCPAPATTGTPTPPAGPSTALGSGSAGPAGAAAPGPSAIGASGPADSAGVSVPGTGAAAVSAAPSSVTGRPTLTQPVRTGDLSGYCLTQPAPAQLLSGSVPAATADATLWADLPVLPIGQPTAIFATAAGLRSVVASAGPGWIFSGPMAGLASWPSS